MLYVVELTYRDGSWWWEQEYFVWSVQWFFPVLPASLLSTVYQCDECLSSQGRGGSWLGCQVLPAIGAVSILELAASSGSSRMRQAPNLHLATPLERNVTLYLLIVVTSKLTKYHYKMSLDI